MIEYVKGWTANPNQMLYDDRLSNNEKVLMMILLESDNRQSQKYGDNYYNSREWLMKKSQMSLATFKKAVKHLKELGYIQDERKGQHYIINYDLLKGDVEQEEETMEEEPEVIEETVQEEPKEFVMEEPVNTLEEIPDDEWQILMNITHKTVVISDAYGGEEKERQLRTIGESCKVLSEYLQSHPEKTRKFSIYLKMIYEENTKKVA